MKLDSLSIRSFRGIRDEELDLSGKSLFVYGENGTGKSSVIDSLDFFFNGSVSHLEGTQALSTKRHAPHVSLDNKSLNVALRFKGHTGTFSRSLADEPSFPSTLAGYCNGVASSRFILRRQQLLAFIMEQAAPRYQQLAALIGADLLDSIELAWKAAADEAENSEQNAVRRLTDAKKALEEALGTLDDFADSTILGALNRHLAILGEVPVLTLADAEGRKVTALASTAQKDRAQESLRLAEVLSLAEGISAHVKSYAKFESLWTGLASLHSEIATLRQLRFKNVLAQAQVLVRDYELDQCPVCLQSIDAVTLDAELTKRIAQSDALGERVNAIKVSQRELRDSLNSLAASFLQLKSRFRDDQSFDAAVTTLALADGWIRELQEKLKGEAHDLSLGSFEDFSKADVIARIEEMCRDVTLTVKARLSSFEQTENDLRIVQVISLLTRVIDNATVAQNLIREITRIRGNAEVLRLIYATLVATKKTHVQAIYSKLESDIARFYEIIHPGELHGNVKLEVVTSRRGSAELKMAFADKAEVDPRAYNSEAHLDSLGLCVFLAFAKRFNVGVPFLALDDVVSSVDATHRRRICELLFTEFADFQLFITTHDAIWFEQLLAAQKALGFHPVKSIRIVAWSLDDGPQFADHKPHWEYLNEKLNAGDKQGAASLARKTLEWLLFELAIGLEAPITIRRDGRYDVGSLLDPTLSRAKKLIPTFDDDFKSAIIAIRTNVIVGNLLTHNNLHGEGSAVSDVKAFVDAVKSLHDIFWCSKCGTFARYHRQAKFIKCDCSENGKEWRTK